MSNKSVEWGPRPLKILTDISYSANNNKYIFWRRNSVTRLPGYHKIIFWGGEVKMPMIIIYCYLFFFFQPSTCLSYSSSPTGSHVEWCKQLIAATICSQISGPVPSDMASRDSKVGYHRHRERQTHKQQTHHTFVFLTTLYLTADRLGDGQTSWWVALHIVSSAATCVRCISVWL